MLRAVRESLTEQLTEFRESAAERRPRPFIALAERRAHRGSGMTTIRKGLVLLLVVWDVAFFASLMNRTGRPGALQAGSAGVGVEQGSGTSAPPIIRVTPSGPH